MTQNQLNKFDEFFELYLTGASRDEMSKHYGISVPMVNAVISGLRAIDIIDEESSGFRKKTIETGKRRKWEEIRDEFYESGLSAKDYNALTGNNAYSMMTTMKRYGVTLPERKKIPARAWKMGEVSQKEFEYILNTQMHGKTNKKQIADVVWQLANEHKTLEEVGKETGLTRERVRQVMEKGARIVRDYRAYDGNPTLDKMAVSEDWMSGLSIRAQNALERMGATTREKFLMLSPSIMIKTSCCGYKTVFEISAYQKLMKKGEKQ